MSSDAVATAAREHAPDEAKVDAHAGAEPASGGSPFAGGATRIANVRAGQIMALQRLAGNAAVAHLVGRRAATRPPSVQRDDPPITATRKDVAKEEWLPVKATSDDPMVLVSTSAELFTATDTIKPDKDWKGSPNVFKPIGGVLFFDDYIVAVDRSGNPLSVIPQTNPPTNTNTSVIAIHEMASTNTWVLFQTEEKVMASPWRREGVKPVEGVPPGVSRLLIYVPGLPLKDGGAETLRKRIATRKGTAKPGAPEDWAKDQLRRLKKRHEKGAGSGQPGGLPPGGPGGVEGGKGLGREDKGGTGGGGLEDDPNAVPGGDGRPKVKEGSPGGPPTDPADPKKPPKKPGGGTGASSTPPPGANAAPGEKKGPGHPGEPGGTGEKPRPLQGDPTFKVIATEDGRNMLQITLDRATTWVELHDGETDGALDGRVDKALEKLQQSRDPDLHGKIAKPATATAFTKPAKGVPGTVGTGADAAKQARSSFGAATPGERIPGAKGGANAPGYPARISMGGNKETAPVTVNGATNSFTMEIDYAALSYGTADEVFNRMQTIQFYWELLDVTGKTIEEQQTVAKTAKVGTGEAIGAGDGEARNIGRTVDNVAEDEQNDLAMMEREDWAWESRAAYLTLIGVSNAVRLVGSLISSFVAIVTRPLNERSIGFDAEGEYLVRCVATPEPSDAAVADPDNHVIRASSIAAMPIKVMDINARANESISEEDKQLAKLEAAVKEAKDDKERAVATAKLEAARKATSQAGQAAYKTSVGGIREQLATARLLKKHMDEHVKDRDLSAPELYLEIALEQRQIGVEEMIAQLEKQLTTMAGEGAEKGEGKGEHEEWVAKQAGTFKGGVEYRPRVVLASEETGQVTPVLAMLGEAGDSTDKHPKWRLIDISSPSSRDIYEGESSTEGAAGHSAAIRDAFRNFAENNEYGRGTIAIRLPAQLLAEPAYAGATIEPRMRSAKGGKGRFMQRLQDLATVAEVVGLFVTGPIGAAVAAVGGVAGAIIAVDSLAKRARTGHVLEVGTIFDILGVVGGVASVAGVGVALGRARIDKLAAAGEKMPGWVSKLEKTEKALHIHGTIGNIQQIIVIPYQLVEELNGIEGGTEGERDARRALALLRGVKSGAVTFISAMGGIPMGKEKAGAAAPEPEPTGRRELPAGHNADAADAHAAGSGPAKPPTQAPADSGAPTAKPAAKPEAGSEHETGTPKPGATGDQNPDVSTPSADQLIAKARELAAARARESAAVVEGGQGGGTGTTEQPGTKPAQPADGGGGKPAEGTGKPAEGTGGKPAETTGPSAGKPAAPAEGSTADEALGADVKRREAMIGLVGKAGASPDKATQEVRPDATKNTAAADPDAVGTLKDAGKFGQLRREVELMESLNDAQRSALKSRLQEARLAVTNEQVTKVLGELQQRFQDLEFHVQDLGTVGFASDRDITIRVTPKDGAAYAKLSEGEQAGMDRRMVLASAEAVPELYKALEAAGFPAERSLDTNFYTELHEGRVKPASAGEATQIAADQQIVSMTEILLNTSHEQWQAYVEQQRAMIEGLSGKNTPEADIKALRTRLDAQVAAAEAHAKALVGDAAGHPSPDRRNAALNKAREELAAALKRQPPPTAREMRQLMADVKLLEPDAYGTRGAVESVVLGGQAMKSATVENVAKDGFRTRQQIEHGEGQPTKFRLDPETGQMREVSAEDEAGRRRVEAAPNVGHRRPGDATQSAYEQNVKRLQVAQAVLGHLLGHMPGPAEARPADTSTAAKNLGRIVTAANEAGILPRSGGLDHLQAIVKAKGAAEPIGAIHKELASWAGEGAVKGWADSRGFPLRTDAERVAAFIGWSREQAMSLTGQLRIRTETGAVYGDVAVGTGRSAPPAIGTPEPGNPSTPPPDGGAGAAPKPMPSGEAPVDAGESASGPTTTTTAGPKPDEAGAGGPAKPPPSGPVADEEAAPDEPGRKPVTPAGPTGPTPPPGPLEQAQAESAAEITRLRSRLYAWRASTNDPAALLQISDHLAQLKELAAGNRRGEPVEGALKGIREDLPRQRRNLRPVDADQVESLRRRVMRLRNRAEPGETRDGYDRILRDIDGLQERMRRNPNTDARTSFDSIRGDVVKTGRQDFEVQVPLTDPAVRAEMYTWFAEHLAPLAHSDVGKVLHDMILRHIDTADDLVLQQSPRGAGTGAASTAAMRNEVLAGIKAKRYPPEYVAAFEAAARNQPDGWPRDQNGVVWEVDHVAELWLGGADDITNYLALPFAIHTSKSEILTDFRGTYRDTHRVDGEQLDIRDR